MSKKELTIIFNLNGSQSASTCFDYILNNTRKNISIYKFENEEIFYNKWGEWFLLEVKVVSLNFDNELVKHLLLLLDKAHQFVPSIKTSNPEESQIYNYKLGFEGKNISTINSIVNEWSYKNNDEVDVIRFVSVLLVRICNNHSYNNGNKRTAIVFVSYILEYFGLYIYWSVNKEDYIAKWEKFMISVANEKNEDDNVSTVYETLSKNLMFNAKKVV